MSRSKLFPVILRLIHASRDKLEWVLFVLREGAEGLVVTEFRRITGLEWLVVLHGRWRLLARRSVWNHDILTDNGSVRVEELCLFGLL